MSQKHGWYWYEPIPEAQENVDGKTPERQPLTAPPTDDKMMTMHPEEIRKLLTTYHEQAIWRPTEENVKHYLKVQDVMRRKAVAMSAAQSYVVMTTPEFNSNKEYPLNKTGMNDYLSNRREEIGQFLQSHQEKYGLLFFIEQSCRYCVTQNSIVHSFADRYGWPVAIIDIKQNQPAALRFNVEFTPQILVVKRDSQKWLPVALGVEPITRLEENAYRAIRVLENNITPDQFYSMEFEQRNSTPYQERTQP